MLDKMWKTFGVQETPKKTAPVPVKSNNKK